MPARPFSVRFPFWSLRPGCPAPAAVRLGALCEFLLSRSGPRRLAAKPSCDLSYVTMASREHWLLLRESLYSVHRTWSRLPHLTVVSDGSWAPDEFRRAFSFWPGPIEILMPEDIYSFSDLAGRVQLARLARAHPLGLKLASILELGRLGRIFFVDSDILWFRDPLFILEQLRGSKGPVVAVERGGSSDSYNQGLLARCARQPFPSFNTGCVYLEGPAAPPEQLGLLLTEALKTPKHNFNEQTILAVCSQTAGRQLSSSFCLVAFEDAFSLHRRKPWHEGVCSRHYVNWMRHQFYRDAWCLRFHA